MTDLRYKMGLDRGVKVAINSFLPDSSPGSRVTGLMVYLPSCIYSQPVVVMEGRVPSPRADKCRPLNTMRAQPETKHIKHLEWSWKDLKLLSLKLSFSICSTSPKNLYFLISIYLLKFTVFEEFATRGSRSFSMDEDLVVHGFSPLSHHFLDFKNNDSISRTEMYLAFLGSLFWLK